ncbi:MAG TPA: hypothetical protein VMN36_08725 [Verrucomicrobiales bacterium]|nr:hypothetical protein [Verrucomicrobiales bacterium]
MDIRGAVQPHSFHCRRVGLDQPLDHRLSISDGFHIGDWGGGWDVRLVFFNDAEYGPYRASIISVDGYPPLERELYFGDIAGAFTLVIFARLIRRYGRSWC